VAHQKLPLVKRISKGKGKTYPPKREERDELRKTGEKSQKNNLIALEHCTGMSRKKKTGRENGA